MTVEGPEIALSSREVQVLTLVLHELATNAVKYGALGKRGGRLAVGWSVDRAEPQAVANIEWVESGVALDVDSANGKRGFGRDLIERAVPYDLGAQTVFEFRPEGLRCELRVPVGSGDATRLGPEGKADGG